ncbi:MAG: T9SS type A sorting domain-containing protein, partial [Fibrobacteria bacterium]|nr:T9SS type A sorting domain-containing protein [Fibrobacteria bacterium]
MPKRPYNDTNENGLFASITQGKVMYLLPKIGLSLLLIALGYSQNIMLKGRIIDNDSIPVSGVVTRLIVAGVSDTTDEDGFFTLTQTSMGNAYNHSKFFEQTLTFNGNSLSFTSKSATYVTVSIYDMYGRLINNVYNGQVIEGLNHFELPIKDIQYGMYLVKVKIDDNIYINKYFHSGTVYTSSPAHNSGVKDGLTKRSALLDTLELIKNTEFSLR